MNRILRALLILTLFCLPLCLSNCRGGKSADEVCHQLLLDAAINLNKFHLEKDSASLDSALIYYNEAEKYHLKEYDILIPYNKAHVYFYMGKYDDAVQMLQQVADSAYVFPEFKAILVESIRAKKAAFKHDIEAEKQHYENIVNSYDLYIENNRTVFDSVLRLPDAEHISHTGAGMALAERYHYKIKADGLDEALAELDSLQNVAKYNPAYFEWLKEVLEGNGESSIQLLFQ